MATTTTTLGDDDVLCPVSSSSFGMLTIPDDIVTSSGSVSPLCVPGDDAFCNLDPLLLAPGFSDRIALTPEEEDLLLSSGNTSPSLDLRSPNPDTPADAAPNKKRRRGNCADSSSSASGSDAEDGEGVEKTERGGFGIPSNEVLMEMTVGEIEGYIAAMKKRKGEAGASEEEKRLRKVRRQMKNREYAQQSRNKKKQYYTDVQSQLEVALSENRALHEQVDALSARNASLERDNSRLRALFMRLRSGAGGALSATAAVTTSDSSGTRTAVAVSACLLCVGVLGLAFGGVVFGSGQQNGFGEYAGQLTGRTLKAAVPVSVGPLSAMPAVGRGLTNNVVSTTAEAAKHGEEYWQWQQKMDSLAKQEIEMQRAKQQARQDTETPKPTLPARPVSPAAPPSPSCPVLNSTSTFVSSQPVPLVVVAVR